MAKKRRGSFLDGCSVKALLQIQEQGTCVAKQLIAAGRPELVKIHSDKQAKAIAETGGPRPCLGHKYHVSAKDLRTSDGIVFDSKSEMLCYNILKQSGMEFYRQPEFVLQDATEADGKKERAVVYRGDFLLGPPRTGNTESLRPEQIVLDVKGMKTPVYNLKRKMFAMRYGRQIVEIRKPAELVQFLHDIKIKAGTHPA
jgi:Protein of unknown function (DUF1064)